MTEIGTELVIERIFDAPRELVYQAFVDEDQIAQWFGPVGVEIDRSTVSVDVKAGGHQRLLMRGRADQGDWAGFECAVDRNFTDVVENELIVGTEEIFGPDGSTLMNTRFEFHDAPENKTKLVIRQGPLPESLAGQNRYGWESSFTKLDALLAAAG